MIGSPARRPCVHSLSTLHSATPHNTANLCTSSHSIFSLLPPLPLYCSHKLSNPLTCAGLRGHTACPASIPAHISLKGQ